MSKKITLSDVFNFENELSKLTTQELLDDSLELLGIRYFEGSLKEGNEKRVVYEYSFDNTMAIEISFIERRIRLWGQIRTRSERDCFWGYLSRKYFESFNRILEMIMYKYFPNSSESVCCEIVGMTSFHVFQKFYLKNKR